MTDHPVRGLWQRHMPPKGYPAGVIAVREVIPFRAFFPGGYGLLAATPGEPLPDFPIGGVMVLGHDFHSEEGYEASVARGCESESQPTWRVLLKVLDRAGISPQRCFFTNYYMGLRVGKGTTGVFPGAKDPEFKEHCTSFLLEQIRIQRPRLILTLGVYTPPEIAPLSRDLAEWGERRGFKHLDQVGPVRRNVRFDDAPDVVATVVALTHPSFRHASIRHRRYRDLTGDDAEMAMLRDARAASGI